MAHVTLQRESLELIAVELAVDGTTVTSGVEVSVTTGSTRPTVWVAARVVSGATYTLVGPYAQTPDFPTTSSTRYPVKHTVWARVADSPEYPVIIAGTFMVA